MKNRSFNTTPFVSVIVTTKNEENNIENCLKSIHEQTYPKKQIEIIVVDNNSTDHTKEISKKYTDKIYDMGPERSAQRNFGAKKSHGKYFMYVDADMTLSPNVVAESVKKLESDNNVLGIYIPEIITGDGFWSKVRRFERSFYSATVIDCVRFIRMRDFGAVEGFDETMSGPEDWDLDKKIRKRGKVTLIKSPIYHNESAFSLKLYLMKKSYYAKSFETYVKKWGKNDKDVEKQFGLYYRFCGVFLEEGKWKKIIQNPALTTGMLFLRILVGLCYIMSVSKRYDKSK